MQSGERIVLEGREYRLDSILSTGAGSYGQVWAAADANGRAVALKFINAEAMSRADSSLQDHWRAHLEREIEFLAGLTPSQSRHIVTLLDHGQLDGQPVLVLERMQTNLGHWLARRRRAAEPPPALPQVLDWAEQILAGLDVIHQAGFVYRDLKLSNILVGAHGSLLKLADFGSLKREDGDSTRSFIGTPATMAPEQLLPVRRGERGCEYAVDFRADYYALGLLLFTLLTDSPSTAAQRRLGELLALHGQEGVGRQRPLSGGLIPAEREQVRRAIELWAVPARPEQAQYGAAALLIDLLDRLLARDPADRPASSAAIRSILQRARVDQASSPLLTVPDEWTLPPDRPPNRHPRRANSSGQPPHSRRIVGLLGLSALAAALAWAVVTRPIPLQESSEPANAVPVASSPPASTDGPAVASPSTPAPGPKPLVIVPPTAPALPSPVSDSAATASARSEPPKSPDSPASAAVSERVASATSERDPPEPAAPPEPEPSAATRTAPETAPVTATAGAEPDADRMAEDAPPTEPDAPIAESGLKPASATLAPAQMPPAAPARASKPTPVRPSKFTASTKTGEPPKRTEFNKPEAAPASPALSKKAVVGNSAKAVKAAPIKAAAGDADASPPPSGAAAPAARTLAVKPEASAPLWRAPAPAPVRPEPARLSPAPVPAKTVSIAKPAPKPAAVQSSGPRLTAHAAKPAASAPPLAKPAPPIAHERPAPKSAPPPVRERVAPKLAAARASPAQTAPTGRHLSPLPPIELVSNINGAAKATPPAQPPIELVSRTRPDPDSARARPAAAIELVSRPHPAPTTAPSRTVPPISSAAPLNSQITRTIISKRSARVERGTGAPDLRRQAENVGNWVSRASASVGTEIQRGLDSANQALSGLTGQCAKADGCGTREVLRRDRWSPSSRGAASH